jgi:hypothetical protein
MSFRLRSVELLTLQTSDAIRTAALKLKTLGGTESEREDKARRMAHIKAKILGGEMTPFRWCVGHVTALGLSRRVNGQQ